jgi:hypothetical protein
MNGMMIVLSDYENRIITNFITLCVKHSIMECAADRNRRRVTIPKDTWESLLYHANDERLKVSEAIRDSITPESIISNILNDYLKKTGHYPPHREAVFHD